MIRLSIRHLIAGWSLSNSKYWNRKLPRSAIQVVTFKRLSDTKRYTIEKEEWLKSDSPGYSLNRFMEALDINTSVPAIDK